MMRRGQGDRLPIPTHVEFEKAVVSEGEIVACSGRKEGPLAALCMALNNSYTATVCVDELGAVNSGRDLEGAISRLRYAHSFTRDPDAN